MSGLAGTRVALLEARMSSELANLVGRYGGEPYCVPAVREQALDRSEEVAAFIDGLTRDDFYAVLCLTGVGVKALVREADRLGRVHELLKGLRSVITVCRGPKPIAVLRSHNVQVTISAKEPHTTTELLEALAQLDLSGKGVALIHYGERNAQLAEALHARGATLEELCLYEWLMPEDLQPLQALVGEIINGRVDAIAFTSQVQVRHLFIIAGDLKLEDELRRSLNAETIVASIGPTCTAALQQYGVEPQVIPEHPRMGHLVSALARYKDQTISGEASS